MAVTTGAPVEVRVDGDDSNGGCFNPALGGVDYSQQPNPGLIITDANATNNSQIITSATGAFTPALLGNCVQINGAFYEVRQYTSPTQVLVDRAITPALSGATLRFGGALASVGKAAILNNSGVVWVRYGIYTTTTTTANVAGGVVTHNNNTTMHYEGYENVRGDRGLKPILRPHQNTMGLFNATSGNGGPTVTNISVDGNGFTSITGFAIAIRGYVHECDAYNCNIGFNATVGERCYASGCNTGFNSGNFLWCVSNGCTTGFAASNTIECIAINSTTGIQITSSVMAVGCVVHGAFNGMIHNNSTPRFSRCIASTCSNKGFNSSGLISSLIKNAAYNCAVNDFPPAYTLTADPFVNSGATVTSVTDAFAAFTLNNTPGGGAMLRGVGMMGHSDIGAIQHQDSGGGGSSTTGPIFGSSIISAGVRTT